MHPKSAIRLATAFNHMVEHRGNPNSIAYDVMPVIQNGEVQFAVGVHDLKDVDRPQTLVGWIE